MPMTYQKAKDILRLDGDDNKEVVEMLAEAVGEYIEAVTGMPGEQQAAFPLCETAAGILLRLWYYPEGTDSEKLQRTADNLLKAITLMAR